MEEQLELQKEKRDLKKVFSNIFLNDLEILLEKCFLMPKKKKEHFITKERLEVDIIRLLQSQKHYTSLKEIKQDLKSLAVYDNKENVIGRIIKIDLLNETVEFENMHLKMQTKSFNDIKFFDVHTLDCVAAFDKQKIYFDKFTYKDTYRFLMSEDKKDELKKDTTTKTAPRYGFTSILPLNIKIDYGK